MKFLISISLIFITSQLLSAQSIVINTGSSIYIPTNADICAEEYGNITGNIFGEGTQCGLFPLPVELLSFSGMVENTTVILKWKTATEVSNYGFEVERCNDKNWMKIGFVEGHGNSNSPREYFFTDKSIVGGNKFKYRLKQVDTDGQFEYSDIIELEILPDQYALFQNYPNPFNPETIIRYQLPRKSRLTIKVYDILGREVLELLNEEKDPGVYELKLDTTNLASGTYLYSMVTKDFIETKKLIVIK
jgi:Secretion system C-terminal sorting domain